MPRKNYGAKIYLSATDECSGWHGRLLSLPETETCGNSTAISLPSGGHVPGTWKLRK